MLSKEIQEFKSNGFFSEKQPNRRYFTTLGKKPKMDFFLRPKNYAIIYILAGSKNIFKFVRSII